MAAIMASVKDNRAFFGGMASLKAQLIWVKEVVL